MAEDDILGAIDWGSMASGGLDVAYTILLIIIVPLIIGGVVYGAWFIMQFKHTLLLDHVTGGKNVMQVKKFRHIRKKKGDKWQVFGTWDVFPPAPEKVIKTTNKGKMFAELAWTAEGNYQWKTKRLNPKDFAYVDNDTDVMVIRPEETFTTVDKQWFIDELAQAEARKKNVGFWQTHGATVAVGFMFLMALSIVIFGAEEVFKPVIMAQDNYLESQKLHDAAVQDYNELSARLERIEAGVQIIEPEGVPSG